MGHEKCGGISAALTGRFHDARAGEGGFIDRWMSQIDESAHAIALEHGTSPEAHRLLEEAAIRRSMANLRTFPFVAEREQKGSLVVLGCHFSIRKGECGYLMRPKEISVPYRRAASSRTCEVDRSGIGYFT